MVQEAVTMQLLFVPVEFCPEERPVLPVWPVKLTDRMEGVRSDPEGPVLSPQEKRNAKLITMIT